MKKFQNKLAYKQYSSMKHYNYTIIIPHHNIPSLLKRCLASIPIYEDIQTIVVDDNSDIKYRTEMQQLEQDFPYVHFHYLKENGGAGKARNIGLQLAKGKYIIFADSDDYFNYCFTQVLLDYTDSNYDIIYFNANSTDTETYKTTWRSLHLNRMIELYKRNPSKAFFKLKYNFGEPWCKMVKKEIILKNQITFDETNIHNDTKYSYLVGFYCKSAHIDERAIYCVTDRIGSVSKRVSADRLIARTMVFSTANSFYRRNNIKFFDERAIRPLIYFILHKQISNANKCCKILLNSGMTKIEILIKIILYPILITPIIALKINKILLNKFI